MSDATAASGSSAWRGHQAGSPRILVVDADDRTRESIAGMLSIRHRFRVVGTAGHPAAAEAMLRQYRPEVVIIDPRLPDVSDGAGLIRRLRTIDPDLHVLAVGWSPDLENLALSAGAHAFVRKTFKPDDLAQAVTRCMDRDEPHAAPGSGVIL